MRFSFLFFLSFLTLIPNGWASTSGNKTLLILPFENASAQKQYDGLKSGIPDLLTVFLSQSSNGIEVVEREGLDHIISEVGLQLDGTFKSSSIKKLGKMSQARYLLRGSIMGSDSEIQIQTFLYDVESTSLLKSFTAKGTRKDLTKHCETISNKLEQQFAIKKISQSKFQSENNPKENLHFIRGLGHYYQGNIDKAMPQFLEILQANPTHPLARFWLGKSFHGAGLKDHAMIELKLFVKTHPTHPQAKAARKIIKEIKSSEEQ